MRTTLAPHAPGAIVTAMHTRAHIFAGAAILSLILPSLSCTQEAPPVLRSPRSVVWHDAQIVAEMQAPRELLATLRTTPAGQWITSAEAVDAIRAFLAYSENDEDSRTFDRAIGWLTKNVFNIGGKISVGLHLGEEGSAVLAWQPGDEADARALDALCDPALYQDLADDEARKIRVRGVDLDVLSIDDSTEMSIPRRFGDVYVTWIGEALDEPVRASLARRHENRLFRQHEDDCIWAHVNSRALIRRELANSSFAEGMKAALGISRVGDMQLHVRTVAQRLLGGWDIALDPGEKSDFLSAVFTPQHVERIKIAGHLLPREAGEAGCGAIDLNQVWLSVTKAFAAEKRTSEEALAERAREFMRIDIEKDLLAHIGHEYVVSMVEKPEDDASQREKRDAANGFFLGLSLVNSRAFAKGFDRALRARALHVSRKSGEHNSIKVYRIPVLGFTTLHYALVEDFFFCGLGERGATRVRDAIDARRELGETPPSSPLPAELMSKLEAHWEHLDPAWHALFVQRIDAILRDADDAILGEIARDLLKDSALGASASRGAERLTAALEALAKRAKDLKSELALSFLAATDEKIRYWQIW